MPLIREAARLAQHLREIRKVGIKVSIDDFGTGYSSLSYLRDLSADTIKIDRSFIHCMEDERSLSLVRSMILLTKELDFNVVAEGEEDEDTITFLPDVGYDEHRDSGSHAVASGKPDILAKESKASSVIVQGSVVARQSVFREGAGGSSWSLLGCGLPQCLY